MSAHRCSVCGWAGDDASEALPGVHECPLCKVAPLASDSSAAVSSALAKACAEGAREIAALAVQLQRLPSDETINARRETLGFGPLPEGDQTLEEYVARRRAAPEDFLPVLVEEHARHDGDPLDIVRHALNLGSGAHAVGIDGATLSKALADGRPSGEGFELYKATAEAVDAYFARWLATDPRPERVAAPTPEQAFACLARSAHVAPCEGWCRFTDAELDANPSGWPKG